MSNNIIECLEPFSLLGDNIFLTIILNEKCVSNARISSMLTSVEINKKKTFELGWLKIVYDRKCVWKTLLFNNFEILKSIH